MRSEQLQSVIALLPRGGPELRAIEAGEIDAVIDPGSGNVIVFPRAMRAPADGAVRAPAVDRMALQAVAQRNEMLACLPEDESRRLMEALEPVELAAGDVLLQAGDVIRHVYFPVGCVVGLLTQVDERRTVIAGLVGREGMLGVPLALGMEAAPVRAVVQVAGAALRLPAARLRAEIACCPRLRSRLHRHVQAELNLARQTVACIASHPFEPRLACWLLMMVDRAGTQRVYLTHQHLAELLNVRRESVTAACCSLRARGLIRYLRGTITLLDRDGLEGASCRCYRPVCRHTAA